MGSTCSGMDRLSIMMSFLEVFMRMESHNIIKSGVWYARGLSQTGLFK